MVARTKLYSQLDSLERELEERLIPHLERAAEGRNDLVFCAEGYSSISELKHRTDEVTESLIALGSRILSLRSKLGESSEGSIAERICWYCRTWGDLEDGNRKDAQGMARQFLVEIRSSSLDG